jgi:hypothetical protein
MFFKESHYFFLLVKTMAKATGQASLFLSVKFLLLESSIA